MSSAGPRDTLALFELDPLVEPGLSAPTAPPPPAIPGGGARGRQPAQEPPQARRPRALPPDYAKLACRHGCGWTHKDRISRALSVVDELGACPGCRRPAAVDVVGFVSR